MAKSSKQVVGWIGKKKVMVAVNRGPTYFCKFYNNHAGDRCKEGTNCKHIHKCNVILPNGKVCNKAHPASEHTGNAKQAS